MKLCERQQMASSKLNAAGNCSLPWGGLECRLYIMNINLVRSPKFSLKMLSYCGERRITEELQNNSKDYYFFFIAQHVFTQATSLHGRALGSPTRCHCRRQW